MKIFLDTAEIEEIKDVKDRIDGVTTNPSLLLEAASKRKEKGEKVELKDYISELCATLGHEKPISLEVIGPSIREMICQGRKLYLMFNHVAGNVWVKIPVSVDGLYAIRQLKKEKIPINTTLIFTPQQALIAGYANADVVSPFAGRLDDYLAKKAGWDKKKDEYFPVNGIKYPGLDALVLDDKVVSGVNLVYLTADAFKELGIECKVLSASLRYKEHVIESLQAGAHIATMPRKVYDDFMKKEFITASDLVFNNTLKHTLMLSLRKIPRDVFSMPTKDLEALLYHPKTKEGIKKFEEDAGKVPEYAYLLRDR